MKDFVFDMPTVSADGAIKEISKKKKSDPKKRNYNFRNPIVIGWICIFAVILISVIWSEISINSQISKPRFIKAINKFSYTQATDTTGITNITNCKDVVIGTTQDGATVEMYIASSNKEASAVYTEAIENLKSIKKNSRQHSFKHRHLLNGNQATLKADGSVFMIKRKGNVVFYGAASKNSKNQLIKFVSYNHIF